MLSSSASRLAKAYCCGKMAQIHGYIPNSKHEIVSQDFTKYQVDGNLRHAIMEYYLNNIASEKLTLDGNHVKGLVKGENWDSLYEFLHQKNKENKLGIIDKLDCKKKIKRLSKTVKHLSKLFKQFGNLIRVGAEVDLKLGSPILISDDVKIERGEIDAVFVFKHENNRITICVVDWKRTVSNKKSLSQYKSQCQVYLRCISEEPSLVGLDKSEIDSADLLGYLVEVGGDEATTPEIVEVNTDDKEINEFLNLAVSRFYSSEANPGGHCSSWCKWAFADDYCKAIKPETTSINFYSDEYWKNTYNHNKLINALFQFKVEKETVLQQGGINVIKLGNERELHLKGITSFTKLEKNETVRIEGSCVRKTPNLAYLKIGILKVLK